GPVASTTAIVVGALFLLSGLGNLIVLDTPLNLLAFEFSNVVFSFVVGMLLLFLGLYGRASSQLPADNPYRQARGGGNPMSRVWQGDNLVQRQPPEPAGEIGELAEAEHAMAEGVATPEQRRLVAE